MSPAKIIVLAVVAVIGLLVDPYIRPRYSLALAAVWVLVFFSP